MFDKQKQKYIDMKTVETQTLIDIQTLDFNPAKTMEERRAYMLEALPTPSLFRCGNMGIQVVYTEGAPPLEEVLARVLLRKNKEDF